MQPATEKNLLKCQRGHEVHPVGGIFHVLRVLAVGLGYPVFSSPGR